MAKKETSAELTAAFKDTLSKSNIINREVEEELKKSFIAPKNSFSLFISSSQYRIPTLVSV